MKKNDFSEPKRAAFIIFALIFMLIFLRGFVQGINRAMNNIAGGAASAAGSTGGGGMAFLKWMIFLAVAGFMIFLGRRDVKMNQTQRFSFNMGGIGRKILLVIVMLVVLSAVGTVPAGSRGVVLRFGAVSDRILGEGIYLVIPVAERVELMTVQIHAYEAESSAASKDLQDVTTKVTLNYGLDPKQVNRIYQTLGRFYETRIIKPAIQETVKATTAKFDAEKLITERQQVKDEIGRQLKERLGVHGMIVDAISITDFHFSDDFTRAIEAKVTAQQLALKAENDLRRVKIEAEQQVTRAKAEATALEMQKRSITADLVRLRQIEVEGRAIEKWDGRMPQYVGGNGPVPILDVFRQTK